MRRKTIAILLCFAVIAGLIPNKEVLNVTAKEKKVYSKSVVKANNYSDYEEIKTPEDMDKLNYVVDGKYCLSADIDMSEYEGLISRRKVFVVCWMEGDIQLKIYIR